MTESSTRLTVDGMTCGHCVGAVKAELESVPGVTEAVVDLGTGQVDLRLSAPVDPSALVAAVEEAGYSVAPAGS